MDRYRAPSQASVDRKGNTFKDGSLASLNKQNQIQNEIECSPKRSYHQYHFNVKSIEEHKFVLDFIKQLTLITRLNQIKSLFFVEDKF